MTYKDGIQAQADVLVICRVLARPGTRCRLGNNVYYLANSVDAYAVLFLSDCSERYRKILFAEDLEARLAAVCTKNKLQQIGRPKLMLYADTSESHFSLDTISNQEIISSASRLDQHKNCCLYIMQDQIIELPEIFTADESRRFKLAMDTVFEMFQHLEKSAS